jgi:hypothetical protein
MAKKPAQASAAPKSVPAPIAAAVPVPELMDVWSRSGSKYRIRSVVLLAVNVLLFGGAACFAYWLRSGEIFALAREGYWDLLAQTFHGVGQPDVSLASFLIEPINIQNVPMQIPIVGLLMAALISIPILVAILYRFWSCLPFIALVGFVAVMPWLAITLLGSCILASVRPFRTRFRFMSALLSLVPAIVYLVLAWSGTPDVVVGRIDPVDRVKFVAPWVLAIVASAAVFAVVLTIARIVNYRPGAVTPLLAVMFALPVLLFEKHVGRDELYYRLLERRDEAYFADVDASLGLEAAAHRAWERHPLPRPPREIVREMEEEKWLFELATDLGPRQTELTRHQAEIADRCDWFHEQFPDSRYTPNALFIKARAWDRRVDIGEFRRTKWIRFYDGFPSVASRESWRIILENRRDTPLGAVAMLRLAQLEARDCDVDRAIAKTEEIIATIDRRLLAGATFGGDAVSLSYGILARPAPESSLHIPLERIVIEAHRLHDLLAANRDPIYEYDPMCGTHGGKNGPAFGLLDLDPRHEAYVARLEEIATAYPDCQLEDNFDLEIAKATPAPAEKIKRLNAILDRYADRDAAPEAMLRLILAYESESNSQQSAAVLARLAHDHPDSIWARQAIALRLGPSVARVSRAGP